MRHLNRHVKIILILAGIFCLLEILAWLAPFFATHLSVGNWCDWYVLHIFPIWYNTYARFMGLFPFSAGEWTMYMGYLLAAVTIVLLLLCIPLRKRTGYKTFIKKYMLAAAYVAVLVYGLDTLNLTIAYHTTKMDGNQKAEEREYTVSDMLTLYTYVVDQCNMLCEEMPRDAAGNIAYEGNIYGESVRALHNLSDRYPQLQGYYPRPKPVFFSKLMTMQSTLGVYYAWTMEANYNRQITKVRYPVTICHELAHLHGVAREDEAGFISVIASLESGDSFFQYSAYLWIYDFLCYNLMDIPDEDGVIWQYVGEHSLTEKCYNDDEDFIREEEQGEPFLGSYMVEDTIGKASDIETDISLKLNGVEDGIASYDRMIALILQYYDGL